MLTYLGFLPMTHLQGPLAHQPHHHQGHDSEKMVVLVVAAENGYK
jgi:hypothetical protein